MNLKKILAICCICILSCSSICFAARGGARLSTPKTPAVTRPAQPATSPAAKPASPNNNEYKPSQNANAIKPNAPASTKPQPGSTARTSTGWGNMLRGMGIFAGGMMLGSLLSGMLGMGGGMMSDVLGLLMNIALAGIVFMLIRALWRRLRGRNNKSSSTFYTAQQKQEHVNFPSSSIHDITPPQDSGYDPKTTAEKYRSK